MASRPQIEQFADCSEELFVSVPNRGVDERVELAQNRRSDQVLGGLGVAAPGFGPLDQQAPARTRGQQDRLGEEIRSTCVREPTAGQDQGNFSSACGELCKTREALGTRGVAEDLVVAVKAAPKDRLHAREPLGTSEYYHKHGNLPVDPGVGPAPEFAFHHGNPTKGDG